MTQILPEINPKESFYLLINYFTSLTKKNFKEILEKISFEAS